MEVSGKKENKHQDQTSSSGSTQVCQPCIADGERLDADGFCQNCQEYLCKTCIKYHRKVTVSKHHAILDKANMPKNVDPQTVKQLCTETCKKHKLEIIKYFCSDHDTVGCGNCMVIDHKTCKVEFIPDIADEFTNGEKYKAILTRLEKLQTKVDSKIKATGTGREACAEEFVSAVQEIKRFRKEIEDYLNKMEQTILKECERLRKENVNAITKNEDFLKTIKSELDDIAECLTSQAMKTTDLFVEAKQTEARLSQLEQDMKQNVNMVLTEYTFVCNSDLNAMVSGSCNLGKLSSKSFCYNSSMECSIAEFEPVFDSKINVHSNADKKDAVISNMLLLSPDAPIEFRRTYSVTALSLNSLTQGLRPFAPRSAQDLQISDVIKFSGQGGKLSQGTIKFIGHLPGRGDIYLGVELDKEDGKHDGVFEGIRYFKCKPSKGVFVAYNKVVMAWTSY